VRSLAKCLGPDLRLAVMTGDEMTVTRLHARQAAGTRWVSRLLQHLAMALWSDPSAGRHLARTAETYGFRRSALVRALAAHGITVTAASGYNVWLPVPHEAGTVQGLADRGWAVAAGERFRLRSGPAVRITTSALEPDAAARLAADVAAVLRERPPVLA
jgi:DNA-binding transcriptional MocR family regulator